MNLDWAVISFIVLLIVFVWLINRIITLYVRRDVARAYSEAKDEECNVVFTIQIGSRFFRKKIFSRCQIGSTVWVFSDLYLETKEARLRSEISGKMHILYVSWRPQDASRLREKEKQLLDSGWEEIDRFTRIEQTDLSLI